MVQQFPLSNPISRNIDIEIYNETKICYMTNELIENTREIQFQITIF